MKKRIVTTTAVFDPGYPGEKAAERLAGLGFEGLDMALSYWTGENTPFMGENYLAWAESLRRQAEELGTPYTHSHAPGEAGDNPVIGRSLEAAGALGARFMVLHPIWRENSVIIEDADQFIRVNAEAVKPWLGKARDCGVTILSENLLWGVSKDPRIVAQLTEAVGSPFFSWCYDTGHANCFGFRPEILTECAAAPLSLHMQDNRGTGGDDHMVPGDGTVDWNALIQTLKGVGYAGDCVLEAHHQSLDAPDEERDGILRRLLAKAKELQVEMEKD